MRAKISFLIALLSAFASIEGITQTIPEYNMSNRTVEDCDGKLKDSEALVSGSTYGHNENFTFVIATGGKISMTFASVFRTESNIDTLRFFDGPDTLSPQIGPTYSGTTPPPKIVALSGFLTVNFKSDASVAYAGWEATWKSEHVPPVPPLMVINPIPACNATSLRLLFNKKIACNPISPSDFTINGPLPLSVTNVTGPTCFGTNDSTTSLTLTLNQALSLNCDYNLQMDLGIADNCDSIWNFTLADTFQLNTCPFTVDILTTLDTVCEGTCTQIEAVITGTPGNCLSYNYTWTPSLPNSPGPHTVCPDSTTRYRVAVQQVGGGPVVNAFKYIEYIEPQITTPDSLEICQSAAPFPVTASPPGGRFSGTGIVNPNSGLFDPDIAGGGTHLVFYELTNFCIDTIAIIVKPIVVGLDEAACPGVAPFMVSGFSPLGGVWTGDSISPTGLFNPVTPGSYTITYTVDGCSRSKLVNVDSVILNTRLDTVCESDLPIAIQIVPLGGIWQGPGITDSIGGVFEPTVAGAGNKTLLYKLNGCDFQIDVFVKEIDAGYNLTRCPTQPIFNLTPAPRPAGGSWSGLGVINTASGTYNPQIPFSGGNGNDTLTYTATNGCTDQKIIYLRDTDVGLDTVFFCENDTALLLDWSTVRRTPCCGVWTGSGLSNVGSNYYFDPSVTGVGEFRLTYTRNTCFDEIVMVVHPTNLIFPDRTICDTHHPIRLGALPAGGRWKGPGVDPLTGNFDPSLANIGVNSITYDSPTNCVMDTINMTVYEFIPANISGIDSTLCFVDSNYTLTLEPAGGTLSGVGTNDSAGTFNPAQAGEGSHAISYTFGEGLCATTFNMTINVLPQLTTTVDISDEEVCLGESAEITINPEGGPEKAKYTYQWSDNLFPQQSNRAIPGSTKTYVIVTSDGCSDPAIDSVTIRVAENFKLSFNTGDQACLGSSNYAKVNVAGSSEYTYRWEGPSFSVGDSVAANSGDIFTVTVKDQATGCEKDTIVKLPSFKNIKASFIVNPNFDCIPSDRKEVIFLDLSSNALTGSWNFGTGDTLPYSPGTNPSYTYDEAGFYTVTLKVENEGGCEDEYSETLCVQDIRPIFVADAFSPNGDGNNDILHLKAKGIKEIYFAIYNRVGQKVFETNNIENGWNGKFRGKPAESGIYIYVVNAKLINNETITTKGNVTLVR